jgi:hypothetical protein
MTAPNGVKLREVDRMQSAKIRAINAWAHCRVIADRLGREMDEATAPHGVPVTGLDEGDSMVVAVDQAVSATRK